MGMNRSVAVLLVIVVCCGFACGQVLPGTFTGRVDDGFTDVVKQPSGVKIDFVTGPCPLLCQNPPEFEYRYRLFTFTGLILPSDSSQTFTARPVDSSFAAIAAILSDARIQSDSQVFCCQVAAIPPITCDYGNPDSAWAGLGNLSKFAFPNATITAITITLSPYAWKFEDDDWWMKQPDSSFATITIDIFGEPGASIGDSWQSHLPNRRVFIFR
jgi:hypothetical protein